MHLTLMMKLKLQLELKLICKSLLRTICLENGIDLINLTIPESISYKNRCKDKSAHSFSLRIAYIYLPILISKT